MLLIKNAHIVTMAGETLDKGYLWIDPPYIRGLGPDEPPASEGERHEGPTWDLDGDWVLPGFIDAHCHMGLFNDGLSVEGHDGNEFSDPVTPQMQAIDGLFQDDRSFSEALASGVTMVMTGPGSANVIGGTFSLLHTTGRSVETMLIRHQAAMKAALGENPKRTHGQQKRSPMTRMANAAILREALEKARHYQLKKDRWIQKSKEDPSLEPPEPDTRWSALLPVLEGKLPLKIHAHRSDDILTAVRIANAYGIRYTLDHCTEGYLVVDILAEEYRRGRQPDHGCGKPGMGRLDGIITGPLLSDRSKPELARSSIINPTVLSNAGIRVAIMTDHPVIPGNFLSLSAAAAVRGGLDEKKALAAITIDAARICDQDSQRGSLEAGKVADLAIFSGHPFDFRTRTRLVLIDGKEAWRAADTKGWDELS